MIYICLIVFLVQLVPFEFFLFQKINSGILYRIARLIINSSYKPSVSQILLFVIKIALPVVLWEILCVINIFFVVMTVVKFLLSTIANGWICFILFTILALLSSWQLTKLIAVFNLNREYNQILLQLYNLFQKNQSAKLIFKIIRRFSISANQKPRGIISILKDLKANGDWLVFTPFQILISENTIIIKGSDGELHGFSSYQELLDDIIKSTENEQLIKES